MGGKVRGLGAGGGRGARAVAELERSWNRIGIITLSRKDERVPIQILDHSTKVVKFIQNFSSFKQ